MRYPGSGGSTRTSPVYPTTHRRPMIPIPLIPTYLLRRITRSHLLALTFICTYGSLAAAEPDFVAAVTATRPIAFYRLNTASGRSEVGATAYSAKGTVTTGPGLFGGASQSVRLNGTDAYILTTQAGGVSSAASVMAWVNLDTLSSQDTHLVYVAGESESGNDLDIQFETDGALRFFTAAGGNATFTPPAGSLVHRRHMIVATLDTASRTRVIYWDGKPAATDQGGGSANKTGIFSIGESTIFRGRYIRGQMEEVALWNRALRAIEVANLYAAPGGSPAITSATPAGGNLFLSSAKVWRRQGSCAAQTRRADRVPVPKLHPAHRIRVPEPSETCLLNGRACVRRRNPRRLPPRSS